MGYGVPAGIVLLNNGMFGTIRMHQERDHPNRVAGTALNNPGFCALAQADGYADPQMISTRGTLDAITQAALFPDQRRF